jgi:tetratricopeptide (TPR) repeat protein
MSNPIAPGDRNLAHRIFGQWLGGLTFESLGKGWLGRSLLPLVCGIALSGCASSQPSAIQSARRQLLEGELSKYIELEQKYDSVAHMPLTLDAIQPGQNSLPNNSFLKEFGVPQTSVLTSAGMGKRLAKTAKRLRTFPDQARGKQLLEQASILATANQDPASKAIALSTIALTYSQLKEDTKAQELLSQVLAIPKYEAFKEPDLLLPTIAETAGHLKTPEITHPILDQLIDVVLGDKRLSKQREPGLWNRKKIGGPNQRNESFSDRDAKMLVAIAKAYHDSGSVEQAKQLLGDIRQAAQSIENPASKANALIAIAGLYNHLNDIKTTEQILTQAFTIIELSRGNPEQFNGLYELATIAGQLRDQKIAKQLLLKILKVTPSLSTPAAKLSILNEVSTASVQLKDHQTIKALLSQSLDIAQTIATDLGQGQAIRSVTKAAVQINHREITQELLAKALKIVRSDQSSLYRVESLCAIAEAYVQLNQPEAAQKILTEATALVQIAGRKIPPSQENEGMGLAQLVVRDMHTIASVIAQFNRAEMALPLLDPLLDVTRSIKQDLYQVEAFCAIADTYRKLGDSAKAKTLLAETMPIVEVSQRQHLFGTVGKMYAELGNWDEALRLAEKSNQDGKIDTLARMLLVYAEMKYPEFKDLRHQRVEGEIRLGIGAFD